MLFRAIALLRTAVRQRRGLPCLPRMLTYTVTFACNARCIMCDSWKMPALHDLSVQEVEMIFAQLPKLDVVRLTGGEPFVRQDLPEIAALAVKRLRPAVLHVTTNGFLTERIVDFCKHRDLRTRLHLLVSVDGVGEKHNQIRGNSRAWPLVMETLEKLAPQQRAWNFRLAVNQTVVDAEGAEHYRRLRDLLRSLGVTHQMVMAYDGSATYNLHGDVNLAPNKIGQFTAFGQFGAADLDRLLTDAERDLAALPWIERLAKRYYLRGLRNRLLEGEGKPNPNCVALNAHLRLFPNGDVPTCQFNSRIVGNLRREEFSKVWQNALAEEQRQWVRRCPGCWAECEVAPNALYSLDLRSAFRR